MTLLHLHKKIKFSVLALAFTLIGVNNVHAFTATSRATGNWNAGATWSLTRTGTLNAIAFLGPSTTITGSGTLFTTELAVNDIIMFTDGLGAADTAKVTAIANNTSLTVSSNQHITAGAYTAQKVPAATDDATLAVLFTVTMTANASINTISLSTGGTLVGGAFTLNVAGNWTNNGGTYTNTGSTVNFNGATTQTIAGTTATTFNNVSTATASTNATIGINTTINGTLTVGASSTFTLPSTFTLTVTGATSVTGTFTHSGTGARTFTGNVTINSGGSWTETGVATYAMAGSLQNDGTFTAVAGVHTFSGTTKTFSGTNTISIPNTTITGTYTNNGTLTVSTALAGAGTLTQGANANLNIGGTSGITGLVATNSGNTVSYTGAAQTVFSTNYFHLTLSGSGTDVLQTGTTAIGGNFTISGTVTTTGVAGIAITGNVTIGAGCTFNSGTFTHTVGGNWDNSGTFGAGAGTITFNASSGTQTLKSNGSSFFIISHNAAGTLQLVTNDLTTGSTFTNSSGTFDANGRAHTATGLATVSGGTYTAGTGTQTFNGALTISGGGAFTGSSGTVTSTNVTISSGTLTAPNSSGAFNVSGNWSNSSTFTHNSGTVTFSSLASGKTIAGTLTGATGMFYNITFNGVGGGWTFSSNAEVANNFTITNGTVVAPTTLTITGSWLNNGTFTAGNNIVTFNSTATGKTIGGTLTGATGMFYNIVFNGVGGAWSFGAAAAEVANDFTITAGTVTGPSSTLTVTRNWSNAGTYTHNSGTVVFNGTGGTQDITSGLSSFYNFSHPVGSATVRLLTNPLLVAGTFDNAGGTFNTNNIAATVTGAATISGGTYQAKAGTQTFTGGLSISNGAFTCSGGGDVTAGSVTLTGSGSLTAPTGTFTVNGAWTNNSGTFTFNANSSTVTFSGTTSIAGSTATTFFNITNSSGTLTQFTNFSLPSIFTNNATFTTSGTPVATFTASTFIQGTPVSTSFYDLTHSSGGTLAVSTGSNFTVTHNFTNNATITITAPQTVTFAGTTSIAGSSAPTFNNLTNTSGTLTQAVNFTISAGTFTDNGTFTGSGTVTFAGTTSIAGSGTTTFDLITISSGTLTGNHDFKVIGNWSNSGTFTGSSGANQTVTFAVPGSQTISGGTNNFYNLTIGDGSTTVSTSLGVGASVTNNLLITNAGTFTISTGPVTFAVTGNITINSGGTFVTNNNNVSLGGNWANSGTYTAGTSTVTFTSTATGKTLSGTLTGATGKFYNIVFNGGGGAWSFGATAAEVANDFTITAGTVTAPSTTLTVTGNWSNAGTFTHNSGTVVFDKASGTQTLNSGGSPFRNISHTGAGTLQLTSVGLTTQGTFANSGVASTFDANNFTHSVTGVATVSAGTYLAKTFAQTFTGGLTLSGGTFTGSTGTVTAGAVTLSGSAGTLTAPSAAFTVNGAWNNTSSGTFTFTPGLNTVTFSGTTSITGATATSFYDVTNSSGTLTQSGNFTITHTLTNSATITTTGTPTITFTGTTSIAGTPTATSFYNLTNSSGTLTQSANFTITKDFTNSGTFTTSGTPTISFTGTTSIAGAGTTTFYNLTNTSGTLTQNASSFSIALNGTFTNSGTYTTSGTPTITFANTSTMAGAGTTTFNNVTITTGTVTGNHSFTVIGNWTNGGTFTGSTGKTVTFDKPGSQTISGGTNTFYNLTIGDGATTVSASLGINATVTNDLTITTNGTFTINASAGAFAVTGNITINTSGSFVTNNNPISLGGSWLNNGSYTAGTSTVTFTSTSGGKTIAGTLSGATGKFYNIVFNGSGGAWSFSPATVDVANDFTITAGTVTAPSGTLTVTGNWSNAGTFTHNSGTVAFDKASLTQTLNSGGNSFNNITHTAAGTLQLTNPLTTVGAFTNSAGTFDASTRTHTITGAATVSGGTYTASTGTQTFNGGLTVSGGTFTGSTGTVTATNVTISSGTLTAPALSGAFNVSGNWDHSGGVFTHNSGTVTLTLNSGTQAITGSSSFFNLTKSVTSAATLTFTAVASTVQNISGTLTLGGVSGNLLSLRSSSSGSPAHINPTGSRNLTFLDVQDNYNDVVATPCTTSYSHDNFNNTNWFFSATDIIWTGAGASTNWAASGNWNYGYIPNVTDNVTVTKGGGASNLILEANETANDFIISASNTVDCSSRTLTVKRNWSNSGTFNGNTGTVAFNGTATSINSANPSGDVFNNLTITSGTLTDATSISLTGNWTNGGTFVPGTRTVTFSGTGTQNIAGAASTSFNNVITSNTANATTGIATTIGGTLVIGNGSTFTVGGFNLTVTGATTVGGGSSGSLVFSSATGTKTFTGLVTVAAGATWTHGNSPVIFQGGITSTPAFTAGTGIYTFNTNASQALSTGVFTIPSITVTSPTILTNNNTLTTATALSGTGTLAQAASAVLNIDGTSGITGLTATAASNIVNYTGASQTIHSNNYFHLNLTGSGTDVFQSGTTAIGGNFALSTAGTLAATAAAGIAITGNVTIGSGTTFNSGAFAHSVGGDWTNNGAFTSSTGSVTLTGALTQAITGTSQTSFYDLTLAKTSNGTVNLGIQTTVTDILALGDDHLFLNTFPINITSTSGSAITNSTNNASAPSATSFGCIVSEDASLTGGKANNAARVKWAIGSTPATSYVFPFGTLAAANYIPFTFTYNTGTFGTLSVGTYRTASNITPLPIPVTNINDNTPGDHYADSLFYRGINNATHLVQRFWQIDPSAGNPGTLNSTANSANVIFTYAQAEIPSNTSGQAGGNPEVNISAQRWNNDNLPSTQKPHWSQKADVEMGTQPGSSIANNTVTVNAQHFFSPWALSQDIQPLPITLLKFTATPLKGVVLLNWATATETNNKKFIIERSIDGIKFETIASVAGAGNTGTIQKYSTVDNKPVLGINYYRLKQVDFDNRYNYTKAIQVKFETGKAIDIAYDRNNGELNLSISPAMNINEQYEVKVFDISGREVRSFTGVAMGDVNNLKLPCTLLPGSYIVSFIVEGEAVLNKQIMAY